MAVAQRGDHRVHQRRVAPGGERPHGRAPHLPVLVPERRLRAGRGPRSARGRRVGGPRRSGRWRCPRAAVAPARVRRSSRAVTSSIVTTSPTARSSSRSAPTTTRCCMRSNSFDGSSGGARDEELVQRRRQHLDRSRTPAARAAARPARGWSGPARASPGAGPGARCAEMPVIRSSAASQLLTTSSVSVVRMPIRRSVATSPLSVMRGRSIRRGAAAGGRWSPRRAAARPGGPRRG